MISILIMVLKKVPKAAAPHNMIGQMSNSQGTQGTQGTQGKRGNPRRAARVARLPCSWPAPNLPRRRVSSILSSVTLAELLFGNRVLPEGQRKGRLTLALDGLLGLFRDRVLPLDTDAVRRYADLAVAAKAAGRGFSTPDGYIAAIAASRGFIVASRDTAPYEAAGVSVIDPWAATP